MTHTPIAEDERPLGQLFWFLLFLGWTPILAAYGHVLDPVTSARDGIIVTFVDRLTLYQQVGWGVPAVGVLTVAGLLSVAAMYRLGWRRLWPAPAFLLWSSLIYVFNPPGLGGWPELPVHAVYAGLAFACTYLFLCHGHLLSPGFLAYVGLLLCDVALHHTVLPGGVLGRVFVGYVPDLITALQFLAVAVLVRMVWLMVRDNRAFFRSLDPATLRRATGRTLKFWWPMPVVFVAAAAFWWAVLNLWVGGAVMARLDQDRAMLERQMGPLLRADAQVDQSLHADGRNLFALLEEAARLASANDWLGAQLADHRAEAQRFYADWQARHDQNPKTLEHALLDWVQLQVGVSNIRNQFTLIMVGYDAQTSGASRAEAQQKIDAAFPRAALPEFDEPSCWLLDFPCHAEAAIVRRVNRLMDDMHGQMTGAAKTQVDAIYDAGSAQALSATQTARTTTRQAHEAFSRDIATAIQATFRTWRNISFLTLVYSLIILLKTLFIVLSRVIFSPKSGLGVTARFLPHPPPDHPAGISKHGAVYRIPAATPDAHYVSRWGVTLEGPPPARRRPMGYRFPVARIVSGTWAMNRIDGDRAGQEDEFDADLKVDEPAELVVWRLAPGERVVFRFADFVGMSDGMRVRRISSLSITTLILGRVIYHAADGPGTLILRTTAAARISTDDDGARPAPMPKLVAWGAETHFGVLAALTTVDTFLSGYNLKVGSGDRVVWDTSTRRGDGPGTGILRFVKSFLLPI
ncbi:hypothetical protein [Actibacterium ureilyticum]|uniref:hypothetical protein n=1 Tax=Actibacterium ureilyticum TaxID=1590614 RepID=UPI000BAAB036|nr:hypothetical protein [Actibacterium ureilyticum]